MKVYTRWCCYIKTYNYFIISILILSGVYAQSSYIDPDIVYDKEWKVGRTQTVTIDAGEGYDKGTIIIKDNNGTVLQEGIMYNDKGDRFIYTYYVPVNDNVQNYTLDIRLNGEKEYLTVLRVRTVDLRWYEKIWLALVTNIPFLNKLV